MPKDFKTERDAVRFHSWSAQSWILNNCFQLHWSQLEWRKFGICIAIEYLLILVRKYSFKWELKSRSYVLYWYLCSAPIDYMLLFCFSSNVYTKYCKIAYFVYRQKIYKYIHHAYLVASKSFGDVSELGYWEIR